MKYGRVGGVEPPTRSQTRDATLGEKTQFFFQCSTFKTANLGMVQHPNK